MAAIKSMDRIRKNWVTSTQIKQAEYTDGINNPRTPWAAATIAGTANYNTGIQKSIAENRFSKGVTKAGDSKWQKNALEKGPTRWAQGVAISADAYQQAFAPYASVIAGLTLPKRGPKGDPANINRVAAIANALHAKKLAGGV
jgi:hypothetical protein